MTATYMIAFAFFIFLAQSVSSTLNLKSPCLTSTQCQGLAICVRQQCECPVPIYLAVAGSCQTMTYSKLNYVPAIKTTVIYAQPGSTCGTQQICTGGSFCDQGSCCCPSGTVVSGQSCISISAIASSFQNYMPSFSNPSEFEMIPKQMSTSCGTNCQICIQSKCVQQYSIINSFSYQLPMQHSSCINPCQGGQICVQNQCACPTGLALKENVCMPVVNRQSKPGGICLTSEECIGGAECRNNICCCPPGLIQNGEACMLPGIEKSILQFVQVSIGQPCRSTTQCGPVAVCVGTCQCTIGFLQVGGRCRLRSRSTDKLK